MVQYEVCCRKLDRVSYRETVCLCNLSTGKRGRTNKRRETGWLKEGGKHT